jgi:hypothetical protein
VSSTWVDLQPERRAAEEVLQRLRETKFVGMEYFGSRDETTRGTSLEEVDRADLYLGLIGGRYGSGITEAEYRRARARGLPCFLYFKDDGAIPPEGGDGDPDGARRLSALKDELRREHIIGPAFRSPADLAARLTADLHRWLCEHHLPASLTGGIAALPADYASRVQAFLAEYLGTDRRPVPFGGRDTEMAQLDAWLDGADAPPYLLLAGPAGRGKSALLVRWTQRLQGRPGLALAYFPVSVRFGTNLAGVVFAGLGARLAALHGERPPAAEASAELWREFLASYLARPLPAGRRLLVVLDGIDEAADWQPSAGLFPASPPAGLRVLVSARSRAGDVGGAGWLAALGWDRHGTARSLDLAMLSAAGVAEVLTRMAFPLDRLGQRVDVVAELHRLSQGDPLLVRLYVEDLWQRGDSVARLRVEDLQAIRPGLEGYFDRWWQEQRRLWGSQSPLREPAVGELLSVLACALGPLAREDLLRLASPVARLNSWALEEALRPLERFVLGDGGRQGYVFGHPRLAAYFYERLTAAERQAVEGRFLNWCGATLVALTNGRLAAEQASPYVLQYHGAHLERAGRGAAELAFLVSDGWRRAWQALDGGSHAGFVADVDRAWRAADRENQARLRAGGRCPWLGLTVRCALCRASVNSLARNLPPALMDALIAREVWTPEQARVWARRALAARQRAGLLATVSLHLPEPDRGVALREALTVAGTIVHPLERAEVLTGLARIASGAVKDVTLEQAAVAIEQAMHALADDPAARDTLDALLEAAALPETVLERAVENAFTLPGEKAAVILGGLAPNLPAALREKSRARALAIPDFKLARAAWAALDRRMGRGPHRDTRLPGLTPELAPVSREWLLAVLRTGDWLNRPGRVCQARAERVADELSEALENSLHVREREAIRDTVVEHLPCFAAELPEELLPQALAAVRDASKDYARGAAMRALAPRLPEPLLPEALRAALRIEIPAPRAEAITALAPRLAPPDLRFALTAMQAIGDDDARAHTLLALTPHLPPTIRERALNSLEEVCRSMPESQARALALAWVMPALPESLREPACRLGLAAARSVGDADARAKALAALIPFLPDHLLEEVFAQPPGGGVHARAVVMNSLAPRLPAEAQHEALAWAQAVSNARVRIQALTTLVPHLTDSLQQRALNALAAAEPAGLRAAALGELAHRLGDALRPWLVSQALAAVRTVNDEGERTRLAAALAPHLPQAWLDYLLPLAHKLPGDAQRARALASLARQMSEPARGQALQQALASALRVSPPTQLAEALDAVAAQLPAPLLPAACGAAANLADPAVRAHALTALAPHMPPAETISCLQVALEAVLLLEEKAGRADLLARLASLAARLPAVDLHPLWARALTALSVRSRSEALADLRALLPVLLALGGARAAAEVYQAIEEVGRWWP